jgi:hypothetical protein
MLALQAPNQGCLLRRTTDLAPQWITSSTSSAIGKVALYDDPPFRGKAVYHISKGITMNEESTTTLFLKRDSLYSKQCVQDDPAAYGIVDTENIQPRMLREPLCANTLCTPALTIDDVSYSSAGGEYVDPTLQERMSATDTRTTTRRAAKDIQSFLGSQIKLSDLATIIFRNVPVHYGEDAAGQVYKLPNGPAYETGSEISVSQQGLISLNGYVAVDWTKTAKRLVDLPDHPAKVYTIVHFSDPMGPKNKRKLCLQNQDTLYLEQEGLDLQRSHKFRKVASVRNAQRTVVADIRNVYTNAPS